jgi:hypothetical protein
MENCCNFLSITGMNIPMQHLLALSCAWSCRGSSLLLSMPELLSILRYVLTWGWRMNWKTLLLMGFMVICVYSFQWKQRTTKIFKNRMIWEQISTKVQIGSCVCGTPWWQMSCGPLQKHRVPIAPSWWELDCAMKTFPASSIQNSEKGQPFGQASSTPTLCNWSATKMTWKHDP